MKPWSEMSPNDKWGFEKFKKPWYVQLGNSLLHGAVVVVPTYFWGGAGFLLGETILLLRETIWQMVAWKGNPHILDRLRDIGDGAFWGGLCALGLWLF